MSVLYAAAQLAVLLALLGLAAPVAQPQEREISPEPSAEAAQAPEKEPWRALWILLGSVFLFGFIYFFLPLEFERPWEKLGDFHRVKEKLDDQARGDGLKDTFLESEPILETHGIGGWRRRDALWFSFLSATHFGTKWLSAQTIFRRLQKEDYRIEPTKWLRVISGFQSVLSIFLLGLFAVTYFQSRVL